MRTILRAPFPAFGGKSAITGEVWVRFGVGADAPDNYVEPFAFSSAILLRRPEVGKVETINDRNAFVANFWRAVRDDPKAVAEHADWPVIEADLHARHKWLTQSDQAKHALQRVRDDPEYYDARIAGWWCWGACCWIGAGWCDEGGERCGEHMPHMTARQGINREPKRLQYNADGLGNGIARNKRPRLAAYDQSGTGLNRPQLADTFSRGVNGNDHAVTCADRRAWIEEWIQQLADRLRPVRVCCGHWSRVCDSPSTMTRLGTTAVFLDPPYRTTLADGKANRTKHIYASDRHQDIDALCDEVQAWCLKWAGDPMVRIALCGLEGEYPDIENDPAWETFAWKSGGGYGNRNKANENRHRERVWFSPHCLRPGVGLFDTLAQEAAT